MRGNGNGNNVTVIRQWNRDGSRYEQKLSHAAVTLQSYCINREVQKQSVEKIEGMLLAGLKLETPLSVFYIKQRAPVRELALAGRA